MVSGLFVRGVSDGFVHDVNHPDRPLGGTDVTATRGTLRALLSERTELRVSGDFAHRDPAPLFYAKVLAVKPGFTIDNPPDFHDVRTSTPAESRHVHYGGSAQLIWRPGPTTVLTSLFAARRLDYSLQVDSDSSELNLSAATLRERHHQISEELTLSSEHSGITWTGGLFVFTDSDRQANASQFIAAGLVSRLSPDVDTTSVAAFGQASVGSRVSGIVGLRSSREDKTMDNSGVSQTGQTVLSSFQYHDSTAATAWTPKGGLNVRLHDEALGYVSATRGFKSGGFNPSATGAGRGFAPEWAWTYELGFKSSTLSKRVVVNTAGYFTDYTDPQVQTPIRPGVLDITNAATPTIRGLEVETQAQAAHGWTVGGHVAWLDARYDRYLALAPDGSSIDVAGHRLSNAPQWSGRVWLEGTRRVGRAGTLLLAVDAIGQSTVYFTPINDAVQRQRTYSLVDANITLRPHRQWSGGVFARNVADADYLTGTSSVPPPAIAGRPGERRQIGVQVSVTK
jgi:iron complex outermembrane receptor protein